jgi:GNAT superfamily N-acetyltransferase
VPHARSRGLARALLAALEAAARDLGYERVRLDTGARQPHARALYEAEGYRSIPDYNGNPYAAFWAEKRLAGAGE